jgi:large subunit ribosomal protein L32
MMSGFPAPEGGIFISDSREPVTREPRGTAGFPSAHPCAPAPASSQENPMAVQQNKKSPSKRGMHRSHNALGTPGTAIEPTTGEVHLRHHISPTGFYRGRKVLKTKAEA